MRGPGINNFDLSLMKTVLIREQLKVQFRGEFFNAWNRTEFGLPGAALGTAQFGVINSVSQSANPARQAQLALKILF